MNRLNNRPVARRQRLGRRAGFTLVELLVVIAIIAVLVAILVPVVGRVRLSAQTAATQSQLQRINAAITAYMHDFNGYPGVTPNLSFSSTNNSPPNPPNRLLKDLTQTEDLVLALMGGLKFMSAAPGLASVAFFDPTHDPNVGKGPLVLNPQQRMQKKSYIQLKDSELTTPQLVDKANPTPPPSGTVKTKEYFLYKNNEFAWMQGAGQLDSIAPEFLDQYSDPRPIIYVRANPNVAKNANNIFAGKGKFSPAVAYNWDSFGVYMKPVGTFGKNADFTDPADPTTPSDTTVEKQALKFFTGAGADTPRNANGYVLFSAGPDRKFGTADDVILGSGGGQ